MHYTIFFLTSVPNPCKMSNWRWKRANLLCKNVTRQPLACGQFFNAMNTYRAPFLLAVEKWCCFHAGKSRHTKWILMTFTALVSAFLHQVSCVMLLLIPCSKATYSVDALKCAVWATSFRLTPSRIAATQLVFHSFVVKYSTHCMWPKETKTKFAK